MFLHECGHFVTARLFGWKVEQIVFYPYGGSSNFSEDINRPLKEELWILLLGPLTQILCYVVLSQLPLLPKTLELLKLYHYSILIFNLLPIYPLDGGKLLNIVLSYHLSYQKSLRYSLIFSFLILSGLFCYFLPQAFSFNLILMFLFLWTKIWGEYRKRDYYYQKFLLERYLKEYPYKKRKIVDHMNGMMRDHRHIIHQNNHYYTERQMLEKKFKKDRFDA